MQLVQLGGLNARLIGNTKSPARIIVLCHGYGAPGDDLVGLASYLMNDMKDDDTLFIFPEAPETIPGMPFGRAWWQIDMLARGQVTSLEELNALFDERPEGLDEARKMLLSLLDAASAQWKIEPSEMIIGGFSQGAMLSTDTALHWEHRVKGLVVLSGTLLGTTWPERLNNRKDLAVFQSHGTHDPILMFNRAERLNQLFQEHSAHVTWTPFRGQHEIPLPVLQALVEFLNSAEIGC